MIFDGKNNEKILPAVFVLIKKKNFASLKEVCDKLKFVAEKNNLILSPKFGHIDFEQAIRKALRHCLPQIKLSGCYFHFKQALGRSIFQHSFKVAYEQNEAARKWVKN